MFWWGYKAWLGAGVLRMRAQQCCRNTTWLWLCSERGASPLSGHWGKKQNQNAPKTPNMPKTFLLDLAGIYTASEAGSRTRCGLNPLLHEVSCTSGTTEEQVAWPGAVIICSWFSSSWRDSHSAGTMRRGPCGPPLPLPPGDSACLGCLTLIIKENCGYYGGQLLC